MRECEVEDNKAQCGCTYPGCSRKGICCKCIRHHWAHKELPGCLFPPELERTYDRSLAAFIGYYKDRI